MNHHLRMVDEVGTFAESKESAKTLRRNKILPALRRREEVELDFDGVALATQSFVHALIADAIRLKEPEGLDYLVFSNCNDGLRSIIEVVVSYCQDDWGTDIEVTEK